MAIGIASGFSDGDVDGDVDMDVDVDVDGDTHVNLDDADTEIDSIASKALSILGIGKCPLSIILMTSSVLFGATGSALNRMLPTLLVPVSIGGAFVVMVFGTRLISTAVARLMPSTETYTLDRETLVGRTGKATIGITPSFGQASIPDASGTLRTITCKSLEGNTLPIGSEILVVDYDADEEVYSVDQSPLWKGKE